MDPTEWLQSLGLERYAAAFRENEIDETVLLSLTAEDLKEIGVGAIGHRRKLDYRRLGHRRSSPQSLSRKVGKPHAPTFASCRNRAADRLASRIPVRRQISIASESFLRSFAGCSSEVEK
jgi:hypothetical protein